METNGHVERAVVRTLSTIPSWRLTEVAEKVEKGEIPRHESEPAPTGEILKQLWRLGDKRPKDVRSATIHRALARMQEKGLVEKTALEDGPPRQSGWKLTERGLWEADRLHDAFEEEFEDLVKRFGGDWANDTEQPESTGTWTQVS